MIGNCSKILMQEFLYFSNPCFKLYPKTHVRSTNFKMSVNYFLFLNVFSCRFMSEFKWFRVLPIEIMWNCCHNFAFGSTTNFVSSENSLAQPVKKLSLCLDVQVQRKTVTQQMRMITHTHGTTFMYYPWFKRNFLEMGGRFMFLHTQKRLQKKETENPFQCVTNG